MEALVHLANLLFLASYYSGDVVRLRALAMVAGLCLIPYFCLRPEPLVAAASWNAFFVAMNGFKLARLIVSRPVHRSGQSQRP